MLKNDLALALDHNIMKVLAYFDIFDWPLTAEEIFAFGNLKDDKGSVRESLDGLVAQKMLFTEDGYYSLRPCHAQIQRRVRGNTFARRLTKKFVRQASLIARFPFVEAVMASGSFSKGYMDENSDLDFFVICKKDRLWISRLLLAIFKRVFYLNNHKHLCTNYFIDTSKLSIEEKNIYTATELATLVPLYNVELYERLLSENDWILDFLPNFRKRKWSGVLPYRRPLVKVVLEKLLEPMGKSLNIWIRRFAVNRWRRIYGHVYSKYQFEIAFKSDDHVSKNHPNNFQEKILRLYKKRLRDFGLDINLSRS